MTQLAPPPAPERPPVDPRFRRRWAEARREEGRRRLRWLGGLVLSALVIGAAVVLVYSPLFKVRHVSVTGNTHTPAAAILAAAGLGPGMGTTLMVHAGSPRQVAAVDALPWVAQVRFTRHWPWSLSVAVTERVPVALVPGTGMVGAGPAGPGHGGQSASSPDSGPAQPHATAAATSTGNGDELVDATGRVLALVSPASGGGKARLPSLPVVEGLHSAPPGQHVLPVGGTRAPVVQELLTAAAASPAQLDRRGLQLSYRPAHGLVATVQGAKALIVLGDSQDVRAKLAVLEELAGAVDLSHYSLVDLTVPQRPALTPLPAYANG
jgi:POTRA domain, FtsQ-type